MKKLAIIIAILMAASSMSACSQAEKENYIQQKPMNSATSDEAESRINTDIFGAETSETENTGKSPVSAFQEPSGVCTRPRRIKPVLGKRRANRTAFRRTT